jgi:hypothetical protein
LLKLNHCVESVSHESNVKDYDLLVKCENGSQYRAKHVITTCSLNYLKENYSKIFSSSLQNEKKISAIYSCKMDTVDKIFLIFKEPMAFFPQKFETIHPLYLNVEILKTLNIINMIINDEI